MYHTIMANLHYSHGLIIRSCANVSLTQWIFDREPVSDYYRYFTVNLMRMRKLRSSDSAALDTRVLQLVEFYGVIQLQILQTILGGS